MVDWGSGIQARLQHFDHQHMIAPCMVVMSEFGMNRPSPFSTSNKFRRPTCLVKLQAGGDSLQRFAVPTEDRGKGEQGFTEPEHVGIMAASSRANEREGTPANSVTTNHGAILSSIAEMREAQVAFARIEGDIPLPASLRSVDVEGPHSAKLCMLTSFGRDAGLGVKVSNMFGQYYKSTTLQPNCCPTSRKGSRPCRSQP